MPLMKDFCFYCSVRLGSMVIGTVSIAIIPLCILLANGADNLRENAIYIQTHPNEFNKQEYFDMLLTYLRKDAETFLLVLSLAICVYCFACFFIIIGAYKLLRWLLWPFIFFELIRILVILVILNVGLIILKDKIDLGLVIAITIAYGFVLLFLFYLWICVIALYQILSIINTADYKELYGDDPLADDKNAKSNGQTTIENVRLFPSPDFSQYSPVKRPEDKLKNRFVTTVSMTSSTDIFEKDFNNLQNHMGSRNRLMGMVYYDDNNQRQKF